MAQVRVRDVRVADVPIRYGVTGAAPGPPVVLLNSLGTDRTMWRRQLDRLASDRRVVVYDARGQGGTPAPPPPYGLEDLGRDVLGLLDHLGAPRAHVVGVSLGGIVALWLAANHPERLLTATFANTAARIGTPDGWEERIATVRRGGMQAITEHVMERFFSERFRREEPRAVEAVAASFEEHDVDGYVGCCAALRDGDLRGEVAGIAVPALVIGGTEDVSTPPEEAGWLGENLPRADVRLLEAGHLSNLERPAAFTGAVLDRLTASYR